MIAEIIIALLKEKSNNFILFYRKHLFVLILDKQMFDIV